MIKIDFNNNNSNNNNRILMAYKIQISKIIKKFK